MGVLVGVTVGAVKVLVGWRVTVGVSVGVGSVVGVGLAVGVVTAPFTSPPFLDFEDFLFRKTTGPIMKNNMVKTIKTF